MKSFIAFLVLLIIACYAFPHFDFMRKTRTGEKQESFEPLTSSSLPPILKTYFVNNHVSFELYTIPNHVKDLLTLNADFSSVFRNKSKISILMIEPKNENPNFKLLHEKLKTSITSYSNKFDMIYMYENKEISYPNPYDVRATKDLMEYCHYFCVIDPQRETLLTFKKLTATEANSIEPILQQYSYLIK